MQDVDEAISRLFDGYGAAVYDKDVDAFLRLYASDARIFDLWDRWSYEGADAWRPMIEGWFASLGESRVKVRFDDVRHLAGEGLALVSATVSYANISPDGEPQRAMQNRLTWGLAPVGSEWKIAHEHTSAPASGETMKVILQREAE